MNKQMYLWRNPNGVIVLYAESHFGAYPVFIWPTIEEYDRFIQGITDFRDNLEAKFIKGIPDSIVDSFREG